MFTLKMGINDPHNGCWLPTHRKYAKGTKFPNAIGHKFVHTLKYADFVEEKVLTSSDLLDLQARLHLIRKQLLDGTVFHKTILTKKGQKDYTGVA